jgi:hypothetical protein
MPFEKGKRHPKIQEKAGAVQGMTVFHVNLKLTEN